MEQFYSSAKIAETFDEMETKMKNKLDTLKIEAQRETEEGKRALSVDQFVYSHLYNIFDILTLIHFY